MQTEKRRYAQKDFKPGRILKTNGRWKGQGQRESFPETITDEEEPIQYEFAFVEQCWPRPTIPFLVDFGYAG